MGLIQHLKAGSQVHLGKLLNSSIAFAQFFSPHGWHILSLSVSLNSSCYSRPSSNAALSEVIPAWFSRYNKERG